MFSPIFRRKPPFGTMMETTRPRSTEDSSCVMPPTDIVSPVSPRFTRRRRASLQHIQPVQATTRKEPKYMVPESPAIRLKTRKKATGIRSEICSTPSARYLMRQVSGLGMEDPVLETTTSSSPSSIGNIFADMKLEDMAEDLLDDMSVASDPTATPDEGWRALQEAMETEEAILCTAPVTNNRPTPGQCRKNSMTYSLTSTTAPTSCSSHVHKQPSVGSTSTSARTSSRSKAKPWTRHVHEIALAPMKEERPPKRNMPAMQSLFPE